MSDTKLVVTPPALAEAQVLLIEDDPQVRHAYARVLRETGFAVTELADGSRVEQTLASGSYDAVVSDIRMPGVGGIEVLRSVRRRDPDLPVVLVTAGGDLSSAIEALEHGALRYLLKPVPPAVLRGAVADAIRLRRLAAIQRRAFELYGSAAIKESQSLGLAAHLERALDTLWMAYQPIVRWSSQSVLAHEALVRNEDSRLRSPDALFECAAQLGRLPHLGRSIRRLVARAMEDAPGQTFFVNLHPHDLTDDELLSGAAPLSAFAARVVLEVTERASLTHVVDLRARLLSLRKMGYRLAVDDLGAGYAGLNWFAQLEPDIVKLDMSLTRDADTDPTKRHLIHSLAGLCKELGIEVVAEGIETRAERDAVVECGCDLLQGYLFAKPGRPFPAVEWARTTT
jgi:EAL domain-containing protein (putative c-di-GMP-specific phosphodiesterase class I)/ActR/RegA family two-component response regulator